MRRILLIAFLVFGNSLLESCRPDDEACFQLDLKAIRNISLENYRIRNEGDTLSANNYALILEGKSLNELCIRDYSFGGRLWADIFYTLTDKVTNISITSNSDLNENYSAGSEIKTLFAPLEITSQCVSDPGASPDCVTDYLSYAGIRTPEQALNEEMAVGFVVRPENLKVFALQTPEVVIPGKHIFTVQFDFQSGRTVLLRTEEITLE